MAAAEPPGRDEQDQHLGHVAAEEIEDELPDVVEDDTALFDGRSDRLEPIVTRTMAAACFATSVPRTPIATPTSAFLSAGASFTPSPSIATMAPRACSAVTIFSLCSGVMRLNAAAFQPWP